MSSRYDDLSRPPLDAGALRRALLVSGSRWTALTVVDALPSTNTTLAELARTDVRDGVVLVTEHQSAGRGRLDRVWSAAPRAGITMSVLVRPRAVPVARWSWIPLLSGLAVAASVRQVAEVEAWLKWPNDVLVDGRKLAGLLVERVESTADAGPAAVVGIGLNVTNTTDELPGPDATSLLLESAATTDRLTLVKAILRRLAGLLAEWEDSAGVPTDGLQTAYRSACSTIGEQVRVDLAGQSTVMGTATGIDATGRLLVDTANGPRVFGAGDVVHVRRPT